MFSCNVTLLNHNLVNEHLLIVKTCGNYTMNELIYKAVFQNFFEVLVSACKINRFRTLLFSRKSDDLCMRTQIIGIPNIQNPLKIYHIDLTH
jgi:hypothetical protein